tara:strand:+ start:1603 stop:1767 length:165 start_codon:yes stop_codon:yes gene_type:complete
MKYFPAGSWQPAGLVWSGKHKKGLTSILPFWQPVPQYDQKARKKGDKFSPNGDA